MRLDVTLPSIQFITFYILQMDAVEKQQHAFNIHIAYYAHHDFTVININVISLIKKKKKVLPLSNHFRFMATHLRSFNLIFFFYYSAAIKDFPKM